MTSSDPPAAPERSAPPAACSEIGKTMLLASDMDGTVIPLDEGPERRAEIEVFRRRIAATPSLCLAYVTGRHLELGLAGVEAHGLPLPDIFVCDVGTAIFHRQGGLWRPDPSYRQLLLESWGDLDGSAVGALLQGVEGLVVQEAERQAQFKRSYYVPKAQEMGEVGCRLRERLAGAGVEASVICSVDPLRHMGLIDVLPPVAAKDYALGYLHRSLGIERRRIVYAGDSGNDLKAFVSGYQSIVVGNAAAEVKQEVRRRMAGRGLAGLVYFAEGWYVRGVIEGCEFFGLFPA